MTTLDESNDFLLIDETLQGHVRSFDNIVLKYQDQIFTLIVKTIGNRADAEDLAQNVFVNAFLHLKKFRMDCSLRTWLFSIAANQIRNYWRSKARTFVHVDSDMQPLTEEEMVRLSEKYGAQTEWNLEAGETKRIAQALLNRLSPLQREIFVLFYIFDHSCEEISKVLNCSPANIKVQLFRGRKMLFEKFKKILK